MKKNNLVTIALVALFMGFGSMLSAQSVVGVWKTIDDETGNAKSHVELYEKDGKLYGKIVKLLEPGKDETTICTECPDQGKYNRKGKPVVGTHIVMDLKKSGKEWKADEGIMDPNKGEIYDCKMWLDEENPDLLHVRGYIYFFYRTQQWHRLK